MPYAVKQNGSYRAVDENTVLEPDETYYEDVPQWAYDLLEAAAQLANVTAELNRLTCIGNAQALALNGRIATLNWLIDEQDPDDEEYIEPTPEDVAERATLKPLLTKWNSYNVKLGKVKTVPAGAWPTAPVWPVQPALYVEGASAVSAPTSAPAS